LNEPATNSAFVAHLFTLSLVSFGALTTRKTMNRSVRIIGIDPGLRRCGWGIIEALDNRLTFVAAGTVTPPIDGIFADRLVALAAGLADILTEHRPDEAAVEETFVNSGARSALILGQARGVALVTPAQHGLYVAEYATNLVKKSVVGTGHAEKKQVELMVRTLLPTASFKGADAADALAVAICHAHHRVSARRMGALA
jgi:crossover junction endodeoxyribonuclease RuvC